MAGSAYIGRNCVLFVIDGMVDLPHHHERDEKHIEWPSPLHSDLTDRKFEDT